MIHFLASEPQYLDHLAPVMAALGVTEVWIGNPGRRSEEVMRRAGELGFSAEGGVPYRRTHVACAASGDAATAKARGHSVALFEHGCGMSWKGARRLSPSYAGSKRNVDLQLFPSPRAAALQRRAQPKASVVDLGSEPWLDAWADSPLPEGEPTVAISFHWNCDQVVETRTCLFAYADALVEVAKDERFTILGHAHPRIAGQARAIYDRAGIEFVGRFDQVLARSHVYAVDVSSTAYEAAAAGRQVVSLNRPEYRRQHHHGLRFWELVPGLECDSPANLAETLARALEAPVEAEWRRRRAVSRVFPHHDGRAAERAARALEAWVSSG